MLSRGLALLTVLGLGLPLWAADLDSQVELRRVPSGFHAVAAETDKRGAIHVALQGPDGPAYLRYSAEGRPATAPIGLVDQAARQPGLKYEVWDMEVAGGRVHIAMGNNAWKLKLPQEEWGYFYTRLDPGKSTFLPVRNINRKPSEGFSLAADGKGQVAACWLSGKLYLNLSHDHGDTFEPNRELDQRIDPCDCCTTRSCFGADGQVAILYREETDNHRDMYLAHWRPGEDAVRRQRISGRGWYLKDCPMTYFDLVRSKNGFAAAWPTKGEIYFASQIDPKESRPAEVGAGGSSEPRSGLLILSGTQGQTLVAWKQQEKLHWRVYDARNGQLSATQAVQSPHKGIAGEVDSSGTFVLFP